MQVKIYATACSEEVSQKLCSAYRIRKEKIRKQLQSMDLRWQSRSKKVNIHPIPCNLIINEDKMNDEWAVRRLITIISQSKQTLGMLFVRVRASWNLIPIYQTSLGNIWCMCVLDKMSITHIFMLVYGIFVLNQSNSYWTGG